MANTKFKIKDLDFYYGDFQALKNINMDIEEKVVTAFIGPSGCGKSTFIKTLNRMQDLVSYARVDGLISLDGQNIYEKGYDANLLRKKVGMVFQHPNPFPKVFMTTLLMDLELTGLKIKLNLTKLLKKVYEQQQFGMK